MAGTYYFITGTNAIAYDYDASNNLTRNTSKDRNLRTILSGEANISIIGATATDNRIALLNGNRSNAKIYILDHNWSRISGEDVSLNANIYGAICATDNRWVVINKTSTNLEFWTFQGAEQQSERHFTRSTDVQGLFSDGTYIYLIYRGGNRVERRTYTSSTLSTFIRSLGSGNWEGGAATRDRFVILGDLNDRAVFYNHSGVLQSSETQQLPAGGYHAVMAVEDAGATLTISTDETNIVSGGAVNIKIASDIDISGFTATDITVTNGTRGSLTRTDARNYVLAVTAGNAGTLTVSIAADVVSPGNAAVSQDFTVNAAPRSDLQVTITGTTNIVQGQQTTLTAAVTEDSNAVTSGLTYAWTASRGSVHWSNR